ncbi:ABC transporter permease [Lichenihabitans psoromatis]|uniref:ABC transporter permease n=1 Tax=Lichenihabitans psoromatis TaxID=2528642 RepID=UPI001036D45A|nr:ABC transporter permease [Lichenihabitans psoromatis]
MATNVTQTSTSSPRGRGQEQMMLFLLLAPALLVVVGLLLVPLLWLAWQSVWDNGFTFENYRRLYTEPLYGRSFLLTFRLSVEVTVTTLLLGYPVAYAATVLPRWLSLGVLALVVVPFWTSVLVRSYGWLVLLQRTGVVNKLLMGMGLIDTPLSLANNEIGVLIGMIHILLPFMVLPLYAAMQKIPRDLLLAGASLGGRPATVFARVFLPLSMPGVAAGTVLVFVLCLGFYITPELLGGGRTLMVSMLISRNIELYNQWGAASAISVVLLVAVMLILAVGRLAVPLKSVAGAK